MQLEQPYGSVGHPSGLRLRRREDGVVCVSSGQLSKVSAQCSLLSSNVLDLKRKKNKKNKYGASKVPR
jgi:hypothetical protein